MDNFLGQIKEDIDLIRKNNKFVSNIDKDEWVFNFWILDNIYNVDPELIESQIIEYKDMAIDGYEFFEDTKDLFIIQNKYYSDGSNLSKDYVINDFLLRPVNALKNGTYNRSRELQNLFNKYKDDDNLTVHFELYVTNNNVNKEIIEYIKEFNLRDPKFVARIYYLEDIKEKYYGEIPQKVDKLTVEIDTIVKGTILNINSENYKLKNIIDARYVFTPITTIYRIYREAIERQYPIFDKNIREYLGNTGVNKNIIATLTNPTDRINFFYYNNGITLICNKMSTISTGNNLRNNRNARFTVDKPQIVNGCQTVNSIYEVLKNVNPNRLEEEFKDTFVMLKVLQIDDSSFEEKKLYEDIVRFNNSQNSIDEKSFVSNNNLFIRYQRELEKRGFLLLIKQSDKNTFKSKYKLSELKEKSNDYTDKYSLGFSKVSDFFMPLEKLMQVLLSFNTGGFEAFTKKSSLLKFNSDPYNKVTKFLKDDTVTVDLLIDLWLLYSLSEKNKNLSSDSRTPISYYLIDCFAKYDCNNRDVKNIQNSLSSKSKIETLVKLYSRVTKAYSNDYNKRNDSDYNAMIKKPIDYDIINHHYEIFKNID